MRKMAYLNIKYINLFEYKITDIKIYNRKSGEM